MSTDPPPPNGPRDTEAFFPGEHDRISQPRASAWSETGDAPPFAGAFPSHSSEPNGPPELPLNGERVGDFHLLRELGKGSFARVYLARQVSLDRLVALKVTRGPGEEGQTLAGLEHDHIVRVFSESVLHGRDLRLLCMQYVPGTTLEKLIGQMHGDPASQRDGQMFLDRIDQTVTAPAALDLAALRDREALREMDYLELVCWIGGRLAEALAHAHHLGVLHRDIKPANILVNRYGRPLLADFNIARAEKEGRSRDGGLGGTLAYMSPEHLDAFNPMDFTGPEAVDVRSDIWSLGVVLFELLTGQLPYPLPSMKNLDPDVLRHLSEQRKNPLSTESFPSDVPPSLRRVLSRCLAPHPSQRYQQAADLAVELDSCRELLRVQKELPPGYVITPHCLRYPFVAGIVLLLVPQIAATIVNIGYNLLLIVNPMQLQSRFFQVVMGYNSFIYPVLLTILYYKTEPVRTAWNQLQSGHISEDVPIDEARRRALTLPGWVFVLACMGWFGGGFVFPWMMNADDHPQGRAIFGHFLFSFSISGLIAVTYSVIVVEFIVLRVIYPGLWLDARTMNETAAKELGRVEGRLLLLQFLAVLIPLIGAGMMIGVGPQSGAMQAADYPTFRLLVTSLMGFGMAGLGLMLLAGTEIRRTLNALLARPQRMARHRR
ncbi:MAG: serine/threonine protein kinase [Gemmataceae bacterium]